MKNFWQQLDRPFFVLAPLANVTDAAFRRLIAKHSKADGGVPYVTYTEFVSADGLCRATEEGKAKLMRDLLYTDAERPIVAQLFSATPANMEQAAALVEELGFDGIDINMGCPDRAIEKQGAGAKLITTPDLAVEIIAAAKRGAPNLPVSVKTRLGYNKDSLEEWLPKLLSAEPAVVTIHARTRKEMSKVPARWERVKRAVEIRNELGSKTLIVGNGDVKDVAHGMELAKETGADGVMIGRGIFGSPWLFAGLKETTSNRNGEKVLGPSLRGHPQTIFPAAVRLRIAVEHTKLFEELLGDIKSFAIMKKHFKAYVEGFAGAKELRMELMEAKDASEVEAIISRWLQQHSAIIA